MSKAEKERKEFQTPISLVLDPWQKIPKKNSKKIRKIKKRLSGVIFSQNGMRQEDIGLERGKIILESNSAHTRPGGANSEKKIAKKFEKLRNDFPALFLAKTG